jgi:MFS transporter, DHA1 family, inner membrane transport protein
MSAQTNQQLIVSVLSAANFIIGMGAFMVIGLLNPVADSFGFTAAEAGRLLTFYALGYAVFSPLLISMTGRIGRRKVLVSGLSLFAAANLLGALAPTAALLDLSRILAAAGASLITPVSAAVAATLSPPERQARALAAVFFGVTLSQVLGVPAGSFIAYTFGWREAFGLVFLMCLPIAGLIWFLVPAGLPFQAISLRDLGRTMINPVQMLAVSFTAVFLGAMYVLYTYVAPLLTATMGFGRDGITLTLIVFGIGAVFGNLIGGQVADRIGPFRTLLILSLAQALIMPMFSTLPMPGPVLFMLALAWSLFGWSFAAAQQVRLISLDPRNASVLLALNAAAIYVGAAAGSAIGATIIQSRGLGGLGIAGGLGAIVATAVLVLAGLLGRRGN